MRTRSLTLLAIATLAIAGCSKDEPTSPTTDNSSTATGGQPTPSFAGNGNWGGTLATIAFDFTDPNIPLPIPISMKMGYAQFGTLSGGTTTGIDAGTVKVEGHELSKQTTGGVIAYTSYSGSSMATLNDLTFDGETEHSWTVSGSGSVPQFDISVQAPSAFSLVAPASGATVSKSSGLALSWTSDNDMRDSMIVTLSPTNGQRYAFTQQSIANTGSFTIPASALASISGQTVLHVVKYRYAGKSVGGKDYYAVGEVVKQLTITIQ